MVIYGALWPNASAHATARRSSRIRFIMRSSGGTRIGMYAICTGMRFCDRQATSVSTPMSASLCPPSRRDSFFDRISARPVVAMQVANVPSRMYANAVVALLAKPPVSSCMTVCVPSGAFSSGIPPATPPMMHAMSMDSSTFKPVRHRTQSTSTDIVTGFVSRLKRIDMDGSP